MAREILATIVAMVAFVALRVVNRLALPRFEMLVSFFDGHSLDLMRGSRVLRETQSSTYLRISFSILQAYFVLFILSCVIVFSVLGSFGRFAPPEQNVEGCRRNQE